MTQPFRTDVSYTTTVWDELRICCKDDHVLVESDRFLDTVSSALWGGGRRKARYFVNGKVPLDYRCADPEAMMRGEIQRWGYPLEETVGLLTAAKLTHASFFAEKGDQFRLLCCATAGTGNAARAGQTRQTFPAYQAGTINVFVLIDGKLTPAAMINGIMTATEAKCAALQELQIADRYGGIATGTTSDAIVLGASQDDGYEGVHAFAGTATTIGNAIGRLVYQAVYEAVLTQGED
jgi:adenosylcobinamide hydrolase